MRTKRRERDAALPRVRSIAAVAATIALSLAACGGATTGSGLSGTISGDGSSTVFPITEAVAEEFQRENPDVQVPTGVSGTGGGFEKFCNGETDFSDASRPIKDSADPGETPETDLCKKNGVEYLELTVAVDGLAVVANKANDWADCLTVEELKKIWEPDSKVKTWKDVRPSFPATDLKLFGPGTDSGTFDYFTDEINGEEGASRTDYTASEDDNTLVTGVSDQQSPGALGYFGYAYYAASRDNLKLLGVDGGEGCVQPNEQTVRDNTYTPLSRPLFVYVSKEAAQKEVGRAFFDFYLENVSSLLADVGYIPLEDAALQKEKDEWSAFAGG